VAFAIQVAGAVLVVAGFALLAPFAGVIVAGALLISFGVALERDGR
jgi:hypothetical protein